MPEIERMLGAVFDTHVWVWASAGDVRAEPLRHFSGRAVVSAISVWEVAMLASKGRLRLSPDVRSWVDANLRAPVELEAIHPAISIESCSLPEFHGDPADRMIVATAKILGLPLITADKDIIAWNKKEAVIQVVEL